MDAPLDEAPARRIYFAGSIRGGRGDAALYGEIIALLRAYGEVLTEHVASPGLTPAGEEALRDREIHDRDLAWLASCDCVIAEVTTASLGVGYEIACAWAWGKPVLCLFRPARGHSLSAMIAGCPGARVENYRDAADLAPIFAGYFAAS
ncbi:MAG: nucleoside 2-deoxyribosyltransferase [Acidobacteria bacterium]|nr:nucleoside 2-deoxyribosyltransferase [Acidobacteriota bacterium]